MTIEAEPIPKSMSLMRSALRYFTHYVVPCLLCLIIHTSLLGQWVSHGYYATQTVRQRSIEENPELLNEAARIVRDLHTAYFKGEFKGIEIPIVIHILHREGPSAVPMQEIVRQLRLCVQQPGWYSGFGIL